jgi:nucleotide-binding universal stress UspA family protein
MFRKILLANDGSTGAFAALRAAIDVAEKYGAELHMISAEPIPYLPSTIAEVDVARGEAERRFLSVTERSKQLAGLKGVCLEAHLQLGDPVPTIAEFARTHGFDLLVVGCGDHSALYNRLIGSTSTRLIHEAPCAVLVFK